MTRWRPTAALVRAVLTAVGGALVAVLLGRPDLLVLVAPFGVAAALALAHAPTTPVTARTTVDDRWLPEGQSTTLRVAAEGAALDQATVTLTPPAHVLTRPASGQVSATAGPHEQVELPLVVSPRRWGTRPVGTVLMAATSPWGGYRWGPTPVPVRTLVVLPAATAFTSTEAPHPLGLLGRNRSRRPGHGSEFRGIRPFQPGDRLRRVNWRTTLRTGVLHAVGTNAEEDSSILLLLDAVTDVGASGGVDGPASSLDVGVRAAGALAAHHLLVGDRVALRVLGPGNLVLAPGAGPQHHRRLQEMLALVRHGWPELLTSRRLRLPAGAGTLVVALSPLLTPEVTTALVGLARRGLTVVVVDTLVPGIAPTSAQPGTTAGLAWRMRMLERNVQQTDLTRRGIPVVVWRGPGTLDQLLSRMRSQPIRTVRR
ncbi:MAG TPA: DUF58 domain-containing protein [Marmoricola sp.]|nr:DUF58 domain-containing protein [Marmoricola sp.]